MCHLWWLGIIIRFSCPSFLKSSNACFVTSSHIVLPEMQGKIEEPGVSCLYHMPSHKWRYMKMHTSCMHVHEQMLSYEEWLSPLPQTVAASATQKTFGDVMFKHTLPAGSLTSAFSGQEHVASATLHTDPSPQLVTKLQPNQALVSLYTECIKCCTF